MARQRDQAKADAAEAGDAAKAGDVAEKPAPKKSTRAKKDE
jgi:hypothetical protein